MPDPRPSSVPVADVATVDLRDLTSGDAAARGRFVETLGRSLVGTGFVKVAGHAVDPARLDAAYRSAREVFALPERSRPATSAPSCTERGAWCPSGGRRPRTPRSPT